MKFCSLTFAKKNLSLVGLGLMGVFFPILAGSINSGAMKEITVFTSDTFYHPERLDLILDDVGIVEAEDSALQEQLGKQLVLIGLGSDQKKVITHPEWIQLLRGLVNQTEKGRWSFFAPDRTEIIAQKGIWPRQRINNLLVRSLKKMCSECEVQINEIKFPREPSFVYDRVSIDLANLRLQNALVLGLTIHEFEGNRSETVLMNASLSISRPAVIATRDISAGQSLSHENFRLEMRPIQQMNSLRLEDTEHKVTRRLIRAGSTISGADVTEQVLVRRGDMIRVISGNEQFEVSQKMQAQDSGAKGARIRLKQSSEKSNQFVTGTVIDQNTVRVE